MAELAFYVSFATIVSFMCSMFEAALYAVPVSHVEALADRGSLSGRLLKRFREDVDAPLAAILSLNTIAHTVGAALAGATAGEVLGTRWLPHFSAVFTIVILLFSEIIPKTAGVVYARGLAPWIAVPIQLLIWVQAPLIWLCRFVTRLVSRGRIEHMVSEEELVAMARMGRRVGTIAEEEEGAIQNVLRLKHTAVRDVMTPRTVAETLQAGLSVEEVLQDGIPSFSRIPVTDEGEDDVVGIVLRRHVLSAAAEGRRDVPLSELTGPIHFVVESLALDRVLRTFLEKRQHLFAVINEFGDWTGVVTLEDVLEALLGRQIVDEFDEVVDLRALARRRRREALEEDG